MTRAVLPHMRRQGSGRILNISSVFGFLPMPYMALYVATKHAVEGYSESLDHELRTRGIRVSVIEPGNTRTRFDASRRTACDCFAGLRPPASWMLPFVRACDSTRIERILGAAAQLFRERAFDRM